MAFRDAENELWELAVDVPAAKRVKRLTPVDLLTTDTRDLFERLADPITLVDVVYAICQPQADERGLSDDEFGARMGIDLEPIATELLESLADFIQRLSPGRAAQAKLIQTLMKRAGLTAERMRTRIDMAAIETEVDRAFTAAERRITGSSSIESPGWPASIPISRE